MKLPDLAKVNYKFQPIAVESQNTVTNRDVKSMAEVSVISRG